MVTNVDNVKENRNKNFKTQNTYKWSEKECKSWYVTWLKKFAMFIYNSKHQLLIFNFQNLPVYKAKNDKKDMVSSLKIKIKS